MSSGFQYVWFVSKLASKAYRQRFWCKNYIANIFTLEIFSRTQNIGLIKISVPIICFLSIGKILIKERDIIKTYTNLYPKIISMSNIEFAFDKAIKHKRHRPTLQKYIQNKNACCALVYEILSERKFTTSPYLIREIFEPKQRNIYILPFMPDRIVHHAIMNIIAPIWDNMFIYDSYSCRPNKGQHRGVQRLMTWLPSYEYALKCDISKFFPNINHDILMEIISHKIRCIPTLDLLADIVYSIPGPVNIPIGNYTSQWFGNLYLNELDMFIKNEYRVHPYIRYCDDFVILSNDKGFLKELQQAIPEFLDNRLRLKMSKNDLFKTKQGIDFLGYRQFPDHYVLLRKSTANNIKRSVKEISDIYYNSDTIFDVKTLEYFMSTIGSYLGWLNQACCYNLISSMKIDILFSDIKHEHCLALNNAYIF